MLIFGFSLNILTLLGLILAIGIVVDDAIVVVENVEHLMETEKLSPYEATKKAMNGLASAFDCHIVGALCRVCAGKFLERNHRTVIPSVYHYYRRFRIASTVVALTLSPVMCSLILKPDSGKKKEHSFPQNQ